MRRLFRVLPPLAGLGCLAGSFAWAIRAERFDGVAIALAAAGVLAFLSIYVRAEFVNLGHYLNAALYTFFVLGLCLLAYLSAGRHDRRLDLTPKAMHTLSPPTQKFLKLLKKRVEIVVFDTDDRPYRDLLNRYSSLSPLIGWSMHDPRGDPLFARGFDMPVTEKTVLICHGEKPNRKIKRITEAELGENTITNGIVEVTRERDVRVLFMQGHGELTALQSTGAAKAASMLVFREFLAGRAIKTDSLNLIETGFIPRDATMIVLAAPIRDLYPVEARQLGEYLDQGGRLLVFFDLPTIGGGAGIDYTILIGLLRSHGIAAGESVVVDLQGRRLHDHPLKSPVSYVNPDHPITGAMVQSGGTSLVLSLVRKLDRVDEKEAKDLRITPIIGSGEEAWSEPLANLGRQVQAPAAMSRQIHGWAVERHTPPKPGESQRKPTRLVVYGSSELVRDNFLPSSNAAAQLMLGTVNWLVEQEDIIPVPMRMVEGTPMKPTGAQLRLVLILLGMAFPSLIFFGGAAYAHLRRKG